MDSNSQPPEDGSSALDVPAVELGLSREEILVAIREGRRTVVE